MVYAIPQVECDFHPFFRQKIRVCVTSCKDKKKVLPKSKKKRGGDVLSTSKLQKYFFLLYTLTKNTNDFFFVIIIHIKTCHLIFLPNYIDITIHQNKTKAKKITSSSFII
jgi:hypothetical protein